MRPIDWRGPLRDLATIERSRLAVLAGLRCALGVLAVLVIGVATGHVADGVSGAVGALVVGFVSFEGRHRVTARAMIIAGVAVSSSVFVGSITGDHLPALLVALALWGLAAGLAGIWGTGVSMAALQAVVVLVVFSALPMAPSAAAVQAAWVLAGSILQLLLVLALWPLRGVTGERAALAQVLRELGRYATEHPPGPPPPDHLLSGVDSLADPNPAAAPSNLLVLADLLHGAEDVRMALAALIWELHHASSARRAPAAPARESPGKPAITDANPEGPRPSEAPSSAWTNPEGPPPSEAPSSAWTNPEGPPPPAAPSNAAMNPPNPLPSGVPVEPSLRSAALEAVLAEAAPRLVRLAAQVEPHHFALRRSHSRTLAPAVSTDAPVVPAAPRASSMSLAPATASAALEDSALEDAAPEDAAPEDAAPEDSASGGSGQGSEPTSPTASLLADRLAQLEVLTDRLDADEAPAHLLHHARMTVETHAPPHGATHHGGWRAWQKVAADGGLWGHALRLAGVLVAGMLLARGLDLANGYWVPMTAAVVVRGDFTGTVQRALGRAIGTLVGAGAVTAVAGVVVPDRTVLVAAVLLLGWGTYSTFRANYGLYSVFLTSTVVVLLALVGEPIADTAQERVVATVIGGALALTVFVLWPSWKRRLVPRAVADLVSTQGNYAAAVLAACAPRPQEAEAERRTLAATARAARVKAASVLGTATDADPLLSSASALAKRVEGGAHLTLRLDAHLAAGDAPELPGADAVAASVRSISEHYASALVAPHGPHSSPHGGSQASTELGIGLEGPGHDHPRSTGRALSLPPDAAQLVSTFFDLEPLVDAVAAAVTKEQRPGSRSGQRPASLRWPSSFLKDGTGARRCRRPRIRARSCRRRRPGSDR